MTDIPSVPGGYDAAHAPDAPQPGLPPQPPFQPPFQPPQAGQRGQTFGGFDASALQNFDPKTVNPLDWGLMGAGLLTALLSFFGYYTYSVKIDLFGVKESHSASFSAWHGFFGWFAALVALAAAVLLAMDVIAKITLPVPVRLVVLGGFGFALLCTLLALVIVPGPSGGSYGGVSLDKGHGFTYWLSLLLLLGATVCSYLRLQQTGGQLPGKLTGRHG